MTRPDVLRDAITSLRQAESDDSYETPADAIKAFAVLALLVAAFIAAAYAIAATVPMLP